MMRLETHQPDDQGVVAHVSRGVQRGHAILSSQEDAGTAVLHQELHDVQVPLLWSQVEGRGTVPRLPVHTPGQIQAQWDS